MQQQGVEPGIGLECRMGVGNSVDDGRRQGIDGRVGDAHHANTAVPLK
ncbi:hypothetical protein [Variovorax sp. EBFNA2]|nr:hypothetical protein [Variovorax boronicumulans]WPG41080.1 hypothetical protein RZE79_33875 [Variovorax boronicumulans]